MSTRPRRIRRATRTDAGMVADILAAAFADTLVGTWLVDNVASRRALLERSFPILVEHALQHGEIYLLAQAAVAVWYPAVLPPLDDADVRLRLAAAAGPHMHRLIQKLEPTAPHRCELAHHHLAYLGVAPAHRGQRLGSALLVDGHRRLDAVRRAAYLEATDVRSRNLYARHGYRPARPVSLADGGPPLWPMWRFPHHGPVPA